MRAAVIDDFGPVENLMVRNGPEPSPGVGQVLVDVHAVGVNYVDLLVLEGKYQTRSSPPFTPGKEIAGVVLTVGQGVNNCKPGDRVIGIMDDGGYAEQAVVQDDACYVIPDTVSFVDAASMMINYLTAYFALMDRATLKDGEVVLINGASGGVGLAAVQLAKTKGAIVLAGLSSRANSLAEAKKQAVLESGADHIIDLSGEELKDTLRNQVYAVTDGRGADIVLDPVGGEVFDASLRSLAWRGRMVILGFMAGRTSEIKTNYLLIKNITASGLFFDSYRERENEWVRRVQNEILDLFVAGELKSPVMRTFPLEACKEALEMIAAREVFGRVVLTTR